MNPNNTQAAWQSRANLLAMVGIVAFWLQRHYGVSLPVELQGMVVDLVPMAITAIWMAVIYFRNVARKVIDRWL
jgi:hypothetical protein